MGTGQEGARGGRAAGLRIVTEPLSNLGTRCHLLAVLPPEPPIPCCAGHRRPLTRGAAASFEPGYSPSTRSSASTRSRRILLAKSENASMPASPLARATQGGI